MNELQVFENELFGGLTVFLKDGEPWFIGKEVATKLGYKNTKDAVNRHVDKEDKSKMAFFQGWRSNSDGYGPSEEDNLDDGPEMARTRVIISSTPLSMRPLNHPDEIPQEMTIINEYGLYSLIFGSELKSARRFKSWVIKEVLPQIKKTGGYIPIRENDTEEEIRLRAEEIAKKTIARKDELINKLRDELEERELDVIEADYELRKMEKTLFQLKRDTTLNEKQIKELKEALRFRLTENSGRVVATYRDPLFKKAEKAILGQLRVTKWDRVKQLNYNNLMRKVTTTFIS